MASSNFILQHWDEKKDIFLGFLFDLRKRPTRKTVHDIRVATKKERSYIRLCREITGSEKHQLTDPLKLFFRISGKCHDVEMSLVLLKKNTRKDPDKLPSFRKNLRALLLITRNATKSAAITFKESDFESLTEWIHSRLASFSDKDLTEKIGKVAAEMLIKIKELSSDFVDNAHPIRKLLKMLHYWLNACPDNPVFNKKEMKLMDEILTDLGDWRDNVVLSEKLKNFRKEYLVKNTEEYEQAKKLETDLDAVLKELLTDAKKKTEELLKER